MSHAGDDQRCPGARALPLHPSYLPANRPTRAPATSSVRQLVANLLTLFASPRRAPAPTTAAPARGLGDGIVELEVVLAVVADLQVAMDRSRIRRASFVLEGHMPAVQLSTSGVTVVALEALRIADLAVSRAVVARLEGWEAREAAVTGRVHFDRRSVDGYRGRGPLRALALTDEHGDEIVLQQR